MTKKLKLYKPNEELSESENFAELARKLLKVTKKEIDELEKKADLKEQSNEENKSIVRDKKIP